MNLRTRLIGAVAGLGLALAMSGPVLAYLPGPHAAVTVSPSHHGYIECEDWAWVWATVLDSHGDPVKNQTVTWAFTSSPSTHDAIQWTTTTTNRHGRTKTKIRLACVPGNRVLKATAGTASGTAVIHEVAHEDHERHDYGNNGNQWQWGHQYSVLKFPAQTAVTGSVLGAVAMDRVAAHGLPNTSTLADSDASPGIPGSAGLVAVLVAALIIARRLALSRR